MATFTAASNTLVTQQNAGSTAQTQATHSAAAAEVPSDALDLRASSEAINSTLMGIALLSYLQSSTESDAGGGVDASAPSTSKGARETPLDRSSSQTTAHRSPSERVHKRYQRMSTRNDDVLAEPLIRTLVAIKASQCKAQYICKRTLTSSTYLRRVHVNAAMFNNLLPDFTKTGHGEASRVVEDIQRSISKSKASGDLPSTDIMPTCYKPNTVIFRRRLQMLDERQREWTITYESLCSAGQRHTRLSAGWAALCRANQFKVGETIVFVRWGGRDDGVVVVGREDKV